MFQFPSSWRFLSTTRTSKTVCVCRPSPRKFNQKSRHLSHWRPRPFRRALGRLCHKESIFHGSMSNFRRRTNGPADYWFGKHRRRRCWWWKRNNKKHRVREHCAVMGPWNLTLIFHRIIYCERSECQVDELLLCLQRVNLPPRTTALSIWHFSHVPRAPFTFLIARARSLAAIYCINITQWKGRFFY